MKFDTKLFLKGVAETIGTMILIFIGCGVVMLTDGNYMKSNEGEILLSGLAFGLAYMAVYYAFHNISGGHFNPAVTFAMWASKQISSKKMIIYIICQFLGATIGAGFLQLLFQNAGHNLLGTQNLGSTIINVENLGELSTTTMFIAFFMETFFSFIFVLVYVLSYRKNKHKSLNGLICGVTYSAVTFLGVSFTGAGMNPARSFGPAMFAMINGDFDPAKQLWIYCLAPIIGALIAVVIVQILSHAADEDLEVDEVLTKKKKRFHIKKEEPKIDNIEEDKINLDDKKDVD